MRELYGPSLGSLLPSEIAARLILAYICERDQKSENWYRNALQMDKGSGEGGQADLTGQGFRFCLDRVSDFIWTVVFCFLPVEVVVSGVQSLVL
jgi:hypothetical protein